MAKKKKSKSIKSTKKPKAPGKKPMSKNCKKSCSKQCDKQNKSMEYREKAFGQPNPVASSTKDFQPPSESEVSLWNKLKRFLGL
jgi:hypothetical protein